MKKLSNLEIEFLEQSNFIEGVIDSDSLKQAINAWEFIRDQNVLTHGVILETHKILMLHQLLNQNEKGYYRSRPVWVGGREGLHYLLIIEKISQWVDEVMLDINGMRRLWKQRHIEFEHIHPFIDGNGRVGRILMNWQRLKLGIPIKVIKEEDRFDYYKWFK